MARGTGKTVLLGDGSGLHGWGMGGLLGGKRALLSGCFGIREGADERRGAPFAKVRIGSG